MKIIVDFDLCAVHGDCVLAAPEVFDLDDDDNVVSLLQDAPPEELRSRVEEAIRVCPAAAIRLEG